MERLYASCDRAARRRPNVLARALPSVARALFVSPSASHSTPDPLGLRPSANEIEARARADVRDLYAERVRRYRTARAALLNCVGYVCLSALPLIPGARAVLGVSFTLVASLMAVQIAITVAGVPLVARYGPLSRAATWVEAVSTSTWIASSTALIAASGSARSVFWFNLGMIVVLVVHTIHHHARVFAPLVVATSLLPLYFVSREQFADAGLAAVFGFCVCLFQRMSTTYGWELARSHARAELVAERSQALVVAAERKRIERDLHDGVAAELTALLWQARSAGSDGAAQDLAEGVLRSLDELRRVVSRMRLGAVTAKELSERVRLDAERLVASHAALALRVELADEAREIGGELVEHTIRVLQEALRNALTHAAPARIEVELAILPERLRLRVADDGRGLAGASIEGEVGGLANMRARAESQGGELSVSARAEGGIEVTLTLPLGT